MPTDPRPGRDGVPPQTYETASLGGEPPVPPPPVSLSEDYEIVGEIGRGGMGVVYKARDTRLGRFVCLKVLLSEAVPGSTRLMRFEREARAISALNHPNICTLYELRQRPEGPCLVLEWIDGETLGELAMRTADASALLPVVAQVARALSVAHAAGVVHRDVKPANVMVRPDGLVKVLDFGVARLVGPDDDEQPSFVTGAGYVVGTVPYMSPEQTRGEPVGPPSDVFGLGAVLYEIVTGRLPFLGETRAEMMVAIESRDPPPPSSLNPGASDLEALLARMLSKRPEDRPTAAEVADALEHLPSRPLPARWSRWWLAALAVAAIGALAVWDLRSPAQITPTEQPVAPVPTIAVLPFTSFGDGAESYYGDGVAEDIIAMLARAPDLEVMSRGSSFAYAGQDVGAIASGLGVDYVLEGSVKKDEDKVRIVAQLVDARTGRDVWSERFDEASEDPWALQDEVTGKIVGALTGELGQLKRAQYRESWGRDSTTLGEYDYYLRGHERYMRFTRDDNEAAMRLWEEGLAAYPDSALLQVKLGFAVFMRAYLYLGDDPDADYTRAAELVRTALAHQDLSPLEQRLGHWLQAYVSAQQGLYAQAIREAETTIELAPYDAFQRGDLSSVLILAGETERALEWIDKALANDPANAPFYRQLRGWALCVAGRYDESEAELEGSIDLVAVPVLQAIDHSRLGQPEVAHQDVLRALAMEPSLTRERWRQANFYRTPDLLDAQLRDLEAAGLP